MVFADVVHSMDIAAAVGKHLREIMTDVERSVVKHYRGTVDKSPATVVWRSSAPRLVMEGHATFDNCSPGSMAS